MTTVAELNYDFVFYNDTQEVLDIEELCGISNNSKCEIFQSYYLRIFDGQPYELYGMCEVFPHNSNILTKIIDNFKIII